MFDFEVLNECVKSIYQTDNCKRYNIVYEVTELPILKLRDRLVLIGVIDFEDLEKNIYCARIKGGILNCNTAYVGFELLSDRLKVLIFTNDGIINQHTREDVLSKIIKSLEGFINGDKR